MPRRPRGEAVRSEARHTGGLPLEARRPGKEGSEMNYILIAATIINVVLFLATLAFCGFSLKLYTEIMKEYNQRRRKEGP